MFSKFFILSFSLLFLFFNKTSAQELKWFKKENEAFTMYYSVVDEKIINEMEEMVKAGMKEVKTFFKKDYKQKIAVYVYPHRRHLDIQWQILFRDTSFHSQCWMVASGVAARLDIVSPSTWTKENCEHNGENKKEVQEIVTHELTHVFHGQYNAQPEFEGMDAMGWLVEGLAVHVSGQLTPQRIEGVKKLMNENKEPKKLENIWSGKNKYGSAGSLVRFIDKIYGRQKLYGLLAFSDSAEALNYLGISEEKLLQEWKNDLMKSY